MKKIKLFLCVALFGAMSFGAFSAYDNLTMSDAEKALLENIEAIAREESYPLGNCVMPIESNDGVYLMPCDTKTTNDLLYNCPKKPIKAHWTTTSRCVEN